MAKVLFSVAMIEFVRNKPDFDKKVRFCARLVVSVGIDYVETTLKLLDRFEVLVAVVVYLAKIIKNFCSAKKVRRSFNRKRQKPF